MTGNLFGQDKRVDLKSTTHASNVPTLPESWLWGSNDKAKYYQAIAKFSCPKSLLELTDSNLWHNHFEAGRI